MQINHICLLFHLCLAKAILMKVIMSNINLLIKQNLSEWRAFPSLQYVLRSTCSVSTSSFQPYFKRRNAPVSLNIKISNCPLKVKLLVMSDSLQSDKCNWHSAVSDSLQPHALWPTRLLRSLNSPGKNTGMNCHSLFQGIFLTQGLNLGLLHCRRILYLWATNPIHFIKCLPLFASMTGVPNPNFPPVIWLSHLSPIGLPLWLSW